MLEEVRMDIVNEIIEVLKSAEMIAVVSVMGANVILAIAASFRTGTFELGRLGDFIIQRVLPAMVYIVVAVLAKLVDGYTAVSLAVFAGLMAMYGRGILTAIKDLTGIEIPEPTAKLFR
jgi:hypothetical protein